MTDTDKLREALDCMGDLVRCVCSEAYTSRELKDPSCNHDFADDLETIRAALAATTTHRSDPMTDTNPLRDPVEMMEIETRLILADFFRRGVSKEKWEDAPHLAARKVRAALAAAPQPAPDREALVEVIEKAGAGWRQSPPKERDKRSMSEAQADALLARGLRLPEAGNPVSNPPDASNVQNPHIALLDTQIAAQDCIIKRLEAERASETMAWAVVGEDGGFDVAPPDTERERVDEWPLLPGEKLVRVAIRVVEGGDDAA